MNSCLDSFLKEVAMHPSFEEFASVGPHTRNSFGESALHFAAIQGDTQIIRLLLQSGADPNLQGEHGFTPLHEAIQQKHLDVIKELLGGGADLRIKNDWHMDAFELASLDDTSDFSKSFRRLVETITFPTHDAARSTAQEF